MVGYTVGSRYPENLSGKRDPPQGSRYPEFIRIDLVCPDNETLYMLAYIAMVHLCRAFLW
jgi:hypothetical protein